MLKFLVRLVFYKICFRVEVINYENIKDINGAVICPNHTTWMDGVFMWAMKGKKIYAMAKAELFKNPIIGWFFKNVINMFPINRGSRDFKSILHAVNLVKDGKMVVMFPEGTRNGIAKGIKPKVGAAFIATKGNVPLVPVKIEGTQKLFSKVKIIIGKPMYFEYKENDKEYLKECTAKLMDEIINLKEV